MHAQSAEINEFADGPGEKEIARLVQKLNSLEEGERTVAKLTECGGQAIGPLKRFLFEGKPSVVYQPRRCAVEALAGIGAKETLIQFLKLEKDIADPAVRLSEEVVENSAAKALSAWRTNEVYEALLNCALPRPRIGLIEALGAFGRVEAISYFIEALEDDTSRSAGLEALRQLGPSTAVTLLAAALTRTPLEGEESTGSIKRRISALEILSDLGPPAAFWPLLRPLITESTSDIVIAVCKIAAEIGSIDDRRAAMSRLLSVLPSTDWFAQGKAENCLVLLYKAGEDIVDGEIARRNASPAEQRATDRVLRTLLRVRHRTREASAA
jgi:HEAT repeat protein